MQASDERWATDLCRIWGGHDGWLTLALVMDCHTQQVLDWQPSLNGKATTAAAAEKLRQQDSHAGAVMVFIRTNPFKANIPQYSNSLQASLPMAISYTRFLARTAITLLERLYRPGYAYQNAGGMLMNLAPAAQRQGSLLEVASDGEKQTNLNRTLDRINQRYG